MKNLGNKEEYVILSQIEKSKNYDFKSSIKIKIYKFGTKILYIIFFFSLINILFTLKIKKKEEYALFDNKLKYLSKEMVYKYNLYINNCINNTLIDKKKYPLVENPKITVIMPIYNGGKYLHYSLRSIQNQKMKDIDIIIIDDCSTDNSSEIIENYMKEDERIRLIKNIENRKILYSKSLAALNSKGKYIIQLDQDDIFIRDDVFDILYNEAEKEDLDLVQIRDICKHNLIFKNLTAVNPLERHLIFPKKTHIKKQPKLKNEMYIDGNYYLLWGLLIKSDIYKQAVYHLWPIIINYKITFHEDYCITFMIIILTQKYKYLNNFALIHLYHPNSTSNDHLNNNNYYLSVLFCGNILFDYYLNNNPKDIKIFIHYYDCFKNVFKKGKKLFPKLYNLLMNKALINQYLSFRQKRFFKKNTGESSLKYKGNFESFYNYLLTSFNNDKNNIKKVSNPQISIIIFCIEYKHLEKTIYSIQKQSFTSYEIILIYDNYEKNDLDLIQKFVKENPNINLIINKDQKGIVYTIALGVLSAKGKYILILEPSNTFAQQNTLDKLYNIISDGNIDILEFNLLINNQEIINNYNLILYKCRHFKSEINLDIIKYNEKYINLDQQKDLLINKLIKADLFKNRIKELNLNETKRKVYNYYDNIFLYSLQRGNINFNQTNIFGVIKNIKNTNSLKLNNIIEDKNQKIKDSIFYINFIFENSYNSFEEKKFVLNEFYNVMNIIFNKFNINNKESESFILYEKFMKCHYITQSDKHYLRFYYNSLIN